MTFELHAVEASTPPPTPLVGSSLEASVKGNSNPVCTAVAGRS
ncbi:hypothetical protein FHT26_002668 [Rhizobacter sp. SG703]|nr:hypothetical protein [Rhizobacter sp. SG703]